MIKRILSSLLLVLCLLAPIEAYATNYLTAVGVQQFSITIAASTTTGTAMINTVGSDAFIIYGGSNTNAGSTNYATTYARLTETNSTTITATRNTASSNTITINGCIIDGTSALIKSVQYGTVTINRDSSSGTATISAVTNANSAVHFLGYSSASTGSYSPANNDPILSVSGTTVTASTISTGSGVTIGFVEIEFQGAVLNQSVQNFNITNSTSSTSWTQAITSVVAANSLIIYGGSNGSGALLANNMQYATLTNPTTITVANNTGSANAKNFNCSVIELISGVLSQSVQRGTITVATSTNYYNTATISSAPLATSLLNYVGNNTSVGSNFQSGYLYNSLTNSTTVTSTAPVDGSGTLISSYEVATFPVPIIASNDAIWFGSSF